MLNPTLGLSHYQGMPNIEAAIRNLIAKHGKAVIWLEPNQVRGLLLLERLPYKLATIRPALYRLRRVL